MIRARLFMEFMHIFSLRTSLAIFGTALQQPHDLIWSEVVEPHTSRHSMSWVLTMMHEDEHQGAKAIVHAVSISAASTMACAGSGGVDDSEAQQKYKYMNADPPTPYLFS